MPPRRARPWPERIPSSRFGQLPGDLVDYTPTNRCWLSMSTPTCPSSTTGGGTRRGTAGSAPIYGRRT
jgi:hypothetical protein